MCVLPVILEFSLSVHLPCRDDNTLSPCLTLPMLL